MLKGSCVQSRNKRLIPQLYEKGGEKIMKKKRGMPIICRLCGKQEESIFHIIAACSYLSSNLYLNFRHNPVSKEMYNELVHQLRENENKSQSTSEPQTVTKIKNTEIWWDKSLQHKRRYHITGQTLLSAIMTVSSARSLM